MAGRGRPKKPDAKRKTDINLKPADCVYLLAWQSDGDGTLEWFDDEQNEGAGLGAALTKGCEELIERARSCWPGGPHTINTEPSRRMSKIRARRLPPKPELAKQVRMLREQLQRAGMVPVVGPVERLTRAELQARKAQEGMNDE